MEPFDLHCPVFQPVGDHGIYDYFLMNTAHLGDYPAFQHRCRDHMRSELLADIEALACYFSEELGLGKGDVYTVFAPTSAESMAVFMALNKLGAIVNFIPPFFPAQTLMDVMTFTKSKGLAVFDSASVAAAAAAGELKVPMMVCTAECYAVPDKTEAAYNEAYLNTLNAAGIPYALYTEEITRYRGRSVPGIKNNGADVAVYMYGGGTTGQSRTIMLSNYALNAVTYTCCCTNGRPEHPGLDTEIGCMPFFHAFGFIASGLEPLVKGAKIILLPAFDPGEFIALMKLNHVVQFSGVPNLFRKLCAHPEWDGPHLASMRICFGGGDDVGPSFMQKFNETFAKNGSPALLHQGYGLTECAAVVIKNLRGLNRNGSIGKPLPGIRVELWDENKRPVPDGSIGEIAITGPGLMEGYLTEDGRLGEGLYTDEHGVRWVLSGDYGHKDADGFFYFDGRKKRLVIISGYNVYPADIERVVTELPFIKENCPVQGFDENGRILVRLYCVPDEAAEGTEEDWRNRIAAQCARRLPRYAVPRDIRFIKALPRTRVQKVDFMKLRQNTPEDPVYAD